MDAEDPGLVRYWLEFDLTGHAPPVVPGQISVDGGTAAYRLLGRGAGVTGYDQADCLRLLRDELGTDLPSVVRVERNPIVENGLSREVGNPAWRGVWFPRLNLSGPMVG